MKSKFLSAVAATALVIGSTVALAQNGGGGGQGGGGGASAAQGGSSDSQSGGGVCTTPGECQQGVGAAQPGDEMMQPEQGQARQGMEQDQTQGQANQQPVQDQTRKQAKRKPVQGEEQNQQTGQRQNNPDEPATTGSTNARADIDQKQRTEIRTTIRETHVEPVTHVDFDINIGIAVPSTIVLNPLPPRIVEIVPAYAGYDFFVLADGTIVIVDPGTLEIVYVLNA